MYLIRKRCSERVPTVSKNTKRRGETRSHRRPILQLPGYQLSPEITRRRVYGFVERYLECHGQNQREANDDQRKYKNCEADDGLHELPSQGGQKIAALLLKMSGFVTTRAERNEILFDIGSQSAVRAEVVDLKILRRAAILAAPSSAHEHRAGALPIGFGFKP